MASLGYLNLNFKKFDSIKILFKNVEELILNDNQCNDFQNILFTKENFPNLKVMDLSKNGIVSLKMMGTWDLVFENLNLGENQIQNIPKISFFSNLIHLNLKSNSI